MDWNKLITTARLGSSGRRKTGDDDLRTEFQRDYDRLIFSSAFRRLQNKTQVFPLPGSVMVHNRLTHSLEVASIGKSLGNKLSSRLKSELNLSFPGIDELGVIVSTACLAHDLGNPPFGHSGEMSISSYFSDGEGKKFSTEVSQQEWSDLISFEGNANAFRILSHQFNGKRKGGMALTYSSLASLIKYPFPSGAIEGKNKYGYFQSDKFLFEEVMNELEIVCINKEKNIYARHPLVFLVEAADDIAYQLMDLEDAMKLRILTEEKTAELFLNFFDKEKDERFFKIKESVYNSVSDTNERIAFLRAGVIGKLIDECINLFMQNYDEIMTGKFQQSLIKNINEPSVSAMKKVSNLSVSQIYKHPDVISVELSGYNILGFLLNEFTNAIISQDSGYSKKLLSLMPEQYKIKTNNIYIKLQSVIDFISSMTDVYALKLYKDIKGINTY